MKKLIGTLIAVAALNANAQTTLICSGTALVRDDAGRINDVQVTRQVVLNEANQSGHYISGASRKEFKSLEFSDEFVTGQVSGGLRAIGQTLTVTLDRYSGVMVVDIPLGQDLTLGCQAASTERLF